MAPTNVTRSSRGTPALHPNSHLRASAMSHDVTMARHNTMSEPGVLALERYMCAEHAPYDAHRRNILDRRHRDVGVAVHLDRRHHKVWLTVDFGRQ